MVEDFYKTLKARTISKVTHPFDCNNFNHRII